MWIPLTRCNANEALPAIRRLRESGAQFAATMADRLEAAVAELGMEDAVLIEHSRWCHTGGAYKSGVDPARDAARAMYGGRIPDRLAGTGIRIAEVREALRAFNRWISGTEQPLEATAGHLGGSAADEGTYEAR